MYDITRKSQSVSSLSFGDEGRVTTADMYVSIRSIDGNPEKGNQAIDVARIDKSVLRDGDFRRDFDRLYLEKSRHKPWVNKWADR